LLHWFHFHRKGLVANVSCYGFSFLNWHR
jgi:hypothetical protein